ncbi:MAG: threonine/serine dehydratase [Gemmatimonadaceae bacterium]|nr:threonine/serine dehydratase [Gemmatimonadaceae bacterium]
MPRLLPSAPEVREAAGRLLGVAVKTPLRRSEALSALAGGDVYLKLESAQLTGSFKLRGAFNALSLLTADERARGIVASSAGNHGLGVAEAAQRLGIAATIFVPSNAPAVKKQGIAARGARVIDEASDYDDAMVRARAYAAETGATFVHPCLGVPLLAGQGTVASEVLDELPSLQTLLVCVGGGGLLGGVGALLMSEAPHVRVVGVQSEHTDAMSRAIEAGRVVEIENLPTLADGLAGQIDDDALAIGQATLESITTVSEEEIASAIAWLWLAEGVRAEGSGAVCVAALRSGRLRHLTPPIVAIVSGANIDDARFEGIVATSG